MTKLLTGLIAGVVIGILIAPDKGSETRRKISERLTDYKDSIEDFVNESTESLESGFNTVKNEANNLLKKGKDKVDYLKSNAQDSWNA